MCLTKNEFQYLYNLLIEARLKDDFDLTCKICDYTGDCKEKFCNNLKQKLRLCVINAKDSDI